VPNFVSFATSTAELARGEKSRSLLNHSLNHSPSLFDAPGTEAQAQPKRLRFEYRSHKLSRHKRKHADRQLENIMPQAHIGDGGIIKTNDDENQN